MKNVSVVVGLVVLGMLAIGCGSGEKADAKDAAHEAASSAADVADEAADAAEVMDATESAADDSVARCLELAAEQNWKDALAPCTEAAKQMPDDLGIKHALQQAQAAAKG